MSNFEMFSNEGSLEVADLLSKTIRDYEKIHSEYNENLNKLKIDFAINISNIEKNHSEITDAEVINIIYNSLSKSIDKKLANDLVSKYERKSKVKFSIWKRLNT